MNQTRTSATATAISHKGGRPRPALVIAPDSLPWRQRLGPLGWTALQHLALSSHRTDQGWAVAVGVRDIAVGLGVTKDTAARAVSHLVRAGLVARGRVEGPGGRRRSGYLLNLPAPIQLVEDSNLVEALDAHRTPHQQMNYTGLTGAQPGRLLEPQLGLSGPRRAGRAEIDAKPSGPSWRRWHCDRTALFDTAQGGDAPVVAGDTGERP